MVFLFFWWLVLVDVLVIYVMDWLVGGSGFFLVEIDMIVFYIRVVVCNFYFLIYFIFYWFVWIYSIFICLYILFFLLIIWWRVRYMSFVLFCLYVIVLFFLNGFFLEFILIRSVRYLFFWLKYVGWIFVFLMVVFI